MEGTRLTIVKVPHQADAYEFSIRTPVTPPRWKDFEQVLASLTFPAVCVVSLCTLDKAAGRHPSCRYWSWHWLTKT